VYRIARACQLLLNSVAYGSLERGACAISRCPVLRACWIDAWSCKIANYLINYYAEQAESSHDASQKSKSA